MHVHVLQHVAFEGIGSMARWLTARQAHVTTTRFYESPVLPGLSGLDLVIVMGGPMSVNDESITAPENQNFAAINTVMDAVLDHVTGRTRPSQKPSTRKEPSC